VDGQARFGANNACTLLRNQEFCVVMIFSRTL